MRRVTMIAFLLIYAVAAGAQHRRRVVPPFSWSRVLLPYAGGPFGSATGLNAELVIRNESDHAVQYHLFPAGTCLFEACPPALQYAQTIGPGGALVDYYAVLPQGRVLTIAPGGGDALRVSLRTQEFYVGGAIGPEGAFKGPQVPIAREDEFSLSIHILSIPVHLNTYLRVYSMDSAATAHVRLYQVEFGKEILLEEFDLGLIAPTHDGPFVMLPAWAERDLTAELASMDQRIPQGRVALRIDSDLPIWAMVMQHDPQRHFVTFTTQQ